MSSINWFEIPVTDIERATKFYNTILGNDLIPMEPTLGYPMAMFPVANRGDRTGALIQGEGYTPSATDGSLIYLNAGDDLTHVLNRVEGAGGKVLSPKTDIGDNGFVAFFTDSEGNKVGLHSMG